VKVGDGVSVGGAEVAVAVGQGVSVAGRETATAMVWKIGVELGTGKLGKARVGPGVFVTGRLPIRETISTEGELLCGAVVGRGVGLKVGKGVRVGLSEPSG
jgi:hypothetical protein